MRLRFNEPMFLAAVIVISASGSNVLAAESRTAVFGGGCFWCMEPPFDKVDGVTATISGFANGNIPNPTYEQVSAGGTGYVEVVQVTYDPERVSYEDLLEIYWPNSDPLDGGGQFCDRGDSYRPAIFYSDDRQRHAAEASQARIEQEYGLDGIETSIEELRVFYPAEDYHQDYYEKNPIRYNYYHWACGRGARLEEIWGERERLSLFSGNSP